VLSEPRSGRSGSAVSERPSATSSTYTFSAFHDRPHDYRLRASRPPAQATCEQFPSHPAFTTTLLSHFPPLSPSSTFKTATINSSCGHAAAASRTHPYYSVLVISRYFTIFLYFSTFSRTTCAALMRTFIHSGHHFRRLRPLSWDGSCI